MPTVRDNRINNTLASESAVRWKTTGSKKIIEGFKKSDPDDFKTAENVSGIDCTTKRGFPRIGLVVDDESQGAQIVILNKGNLIAGRFLHLMKDVGDGRPLAFEGEPLDFDGEGVAYAGGAFYVIGSHGRPRHSDTIEGADPTIRAKADAKAKASRTLFRVKFEPDRVDIETGELPGRYDVVATDALAKILGDHDVLGDEFNDRLDDDGLSIEGLAARSGRLLIGMRTPVLEDGSALILEWPITSLFQGKSRKGQLHKVQLGKDSYGKARGTRDLGRRGKDVYILAGPKLDPKDRDEPARDGDYAIFRWRGDAVTELARLPSFGVAEKTGKPMKPEALLPLNMTKDGLRILLLFDGPKQGGARSIVIPLP